MSLQGSKAAPSENATCTAANSTSEVVREDVVHPAIVTALRLNQRRNSVSALERVQSGNVIAHLRKSGDMLTPSPRLSRNPDLNTSTDSGSNTPRK